MNKAIVNGRMTKDPEVRYSGETCIARFTLAVDRRFKKQGEQEADFFNCTAFGKQGEFVEKYLKQGSKILITGRIQNDNYTDRDGNKRSSVQIITEEIEFGESKKDVAPAKKPEVKDDFVPMPEGDEQLPFSF